MKDTEYILGINGYSGKAFQKFIEVNHLYEKYNFIGIARCIAKTSHAISFFEVDLLNVNWSEVFLSGNPNYIINLVAISDIQDFDLLFKSNVLLPQSLLEFIAQNKLAVKKTLLIGSAAEYGKNENLPLMEDSEFMPVSHYGLSKVFQSNLAKFYFNN